MYVNVPPTLRRLSALAVALASMFALHPPSMVEMIGVSTASAQQDVAIADSLVLIGIGPPDTLLLVKPTDGLGIDRVSFSALRQIELVLSDDSPEDKEGGGALFGVDVRAYDDSGHAFHSGFTFGSDGSRQVYASDTLVPEVQFGFRRVGYVAADGGEKVLVRLVLDSEYPGPAPMATQQMVVELVVANDYRLEVLLDGILVGVARASGNVKDGSNQVVIHLVFSGMPGDGGTIVGRSTWGQLKGYK